MATQSILEWTEEDSGYEKRSFSVVDAVGMCRAAGGGQFSPGSPNAPTISPTCAGVYVLDFGESPEASSSSRRFG